MSTFAALAMWMVWALAYFVGFSESTWFPGFRDLNGPIGVIADQQLAAGTLWALSAATFLPVIFANLMRFLSEDDDDVDDELRRLVRAARRSWRSP